MLNKLDLIPPQMSADEFADALHNITGIAPLDKRWRFQDTSKRIELAKHFHEAVQAFVQGPEKRMRAKVQAFLTTSDLAQPVTQIFDQINDITNFDMGWAMCYKDASNRIEPGRDIWEIATVTDMLGWQLVPEGHSVKIQDRTATVVTAKVHKFGNGLAWTDEMIRFRKIGPLLDTAEAFVRGYHKDKADRMYNLIADARSTTRAATAGGTVETHITDINDAAAAILRGVKDTLNLPVTENLCIIARPEARAKITRALGELSQNFQTSTIRVVYNIIPIYSFNANLPAAATGEAEACLMCIPGYRSQTAEVMAPTFYEDRDILTLSSIQTCFAYYGAIVADPNQVIQFGLS